jgi:ADP-ribosylglycohydrolase
MISDDTEDACMVAQAIMSSSDVEGFQRALARRLRTWLRIAPAGVGLATLRACLKLNLGFGPKRSGVFSAGNGPCMRSGILGVAIDDIDRLWAYVVASTRITHTDPKAACGAFAIALAARAVRRNEHSDLNEIGGELVRRCSSEASHELVQSLYKARESIERRESTADFAISIGQSRGVSGYVNHTVPIALHAACLHPKDFRVAISSVVECGGDADTTAAIVGGIVGAAVGEGGIPSEWQAGVFEWPRTLAWMNQLGRTLASDVSHGFAANTGKLNAIALFARNMFFTAAVLSHGVRRLLPPY